MRALPVQLQRSLRASLDWRSVGHGTPDLVHFFVRYRDAPIRPVSRAVAGANPSVLVRQTVEHDITARRYSKLAGACPVLPIGTGDLNRAIELAVLVTAIENVLTR